MHYSIIFNIFFVDTNVLCQNKKYIWMKSIQSEDHKLDDLFFGYQKILEPILFAIYLSFNEVLLLMLFKIGARLVVPISLHIA